MVIRGKIESYIYFAGILDGEGNFVIARDRKLRQGYLKPKYEPGITVVNTSKVLMDWLVENIGGSYCKRKNNDTANHKDTYSWKIGPKSFLSELKQVIPFLVIKKHQAELIVKFYEEALQTKFGNGKPMCRQEFERREALYQELRKEIDSRRPQRLNEGEPISLNWLSDSLTSTET